MEGSKALRTIQPQPGPQHRLLTCPADQILYGGARGGGKSFGLLLDWAKHQAKYGSHALGIVFRKEIDQLEALLRDMRPIYSALGGRFHETKRCFTFPNGAQLFLRQITRRKDAEKYQGWSLTWVAIDEGGNYATPEEIDLLSAAQRSTHPGLRKRLIITANPGGVGHNWIKARFIDPSPPNRIFEVSLPTGGTVTRAFIPSLLSDNPILMDADPGYPDQIRRSGPEWLVKAWLNGDWNIVAGGYFDDLWDVGTHIVDPFPIPHTWRIDRSFDWGSSRPFSVGWWAQSDGCDVPMPDGSVVATVRGDLFRIHEWYGWSGKPNEGVRMTASEVAAGIVERELHWKIRNGDRCRVMTGPADSSIFAVEDGSSIAKNMLQPVRVGGRQFPGIKWKPANKAPGSRKAGWELLRKLLKQSSPEKPGLPRERPGIFVFEECRHFIRTVPTLPRDQRDPDDVDSDAEDHVADEVRYRAAWKPTTVGSATTRG